MPRPPAASWHFYSAFYDWARLASPSSCSITSLRRSLRIPRTRIGVTHNGRHYASEVARKDGPSQKTLSDTQQRIIRKWRDTPVETLAERPFTSLNAWDQAVRYRSDSSIVYELALPETHIQQMRSRYGFQLERLTKRNGGAVNLGSLEKKMECGDRLRSVLVSGTFEEAARLDAYMQSQRPTVRHVGTPTPPGSQSNAVPQREIVGGSTTTQAIGDTAQSIIQSSWLTSPVRSFLDVPFASQAPWTVIVRERTRSRIRLEMVLPNDRVAVLRAHYGYDLSTISQKSRTQTRVLSSMGLYTDRNAAVITILGNPVGAEMAMNLVLAMKDIDPPAMAMAEAQMSQWFVRQPVLSSSELPSHSIQPWRSALRSYDADKDRGVLEFVAARQEWESFMKKRWSSGDSAGDLDISFEVNTVEDQSTSDGTMARSSSPGQSSDKLLIEITGTALRLQEFLEDMRWVRRVHQLPLPKRSPHSASSQNFATPSAAAVSLEQPNARSGDAVSEAPPSTNVVEDLKAVLRPLTHPVVLITSRLPSRRAVNPDKLDLCRGVTVSSFSAVTMSPERSVVTFNLKVPSRTWEAIKSSGNFVAHVLAATSKGAAFAHAFTLPHEKPEAPFNMIRKLGAYVSIFSRGRLAPVIASREAVLARISAKLCDDGKQCIQVGDHMIVVAEVVSVSCLKSHESSQDHNQDISAVLDSVGLAYAQREYRGLGESLRMAELSSGDDLEEANAAPTQEGPEQKPEQLEDADPEPMEVKSMELGLEEDLPNMGSIATTNHTTEERPSQSEAVQSSSVDDFFQAMSEDTGVDQDEARDSEAFSAQEPDTDVDPLPNDKSFTTERVPDGVDDYSTHQPNAEHQARKRKLALAEEDEYDLGFAQQDEPTSSAPPSSTSDVHPQTTGSSPGAEPRRRNLSGDYAWGQPVSRRNISTSARRSTDPSGRT